MDRRNVLIMFFFEIKLNNKKYQRRNKIPKN